MKTREQKNEYQHKWRIKNIEKVRSSGRRSYHKCKKLHPKTTPNKVFDAKYHREWAMKNPEKAAEKARAYRKRHPEKVALWERRYKLQTSYGITIEDYELMLKNQNGKCAICGNQPNGKAFGVDHNHITGEVRGLLCFNCNTALGLLKDNIDIANKLIDYLIRFN